MNFGSRIYVDPTINVKQKYGSTANFYKTEIQKIDLSDTKKTADYANDWIKKLTEGNIPNLVEEREIIISLKKRTYFTFVLIDFFHCRGFEKCGHRFAERYLLQRHLGTPISHERDEN